MDGAYVNHYIRPKNKKSERIDRRLAVNQRDDKRCVIGHASRHRENQNLCT
jgi:hypothetical protein